MAHDSPSTSSNRTATLGKVGALLVFVALLCVPPPADMPPAAWRLAAVTLAMACLWITQAIPIAATSLVPLAAYPLLGIQSAEEVSKAYVDKYVILFLGGFIIALGIEKWGLHRRLALHIVRVLGTGLRRMVLGFMAATAFLSMWISNTASTLLMLPIALALAAEIREARSNDHSHGDAVRDDAAFDRFATVLMIAIAYAASIGGFTTLVGTPTNVAFQGIWAKRFPKAEYPGVPELSAGEWTLAVLPLGIAMLFCAWGLLTWRLPGRIGGRPLGRRFFTDRLRAMGRPSVAEWRMLAVFLATAVLWIFRKPFRFGGTVLIPGWGDLVANGLSDWNVTAKMIHDSTVAIVMALLMFVIPAKRSRNAPTEYLMDWKTAEKLPWGILLLIGGGFAIAGGFQQTELDAWLAGELSALVKDWPIWLVVAAVCFLLTFLTELTSNVATVSTLLPVLAGTAIAIGVDPRLVMIPATISASCAFMLPIATPPNAIVFGSGKIRMGQMASYGVVLNLIGVVLVTAATFLLLAPQLGVPLEGLPAWVGGTPGE
ncbi:MAG: SLC13 family permease [Planctomycetaceae bacterium]